MAQLKLLDEIVKAKPELAERKEEFMLAVFESIVGSQ